MLLFHFHTLHANALWKVPSRFPPRGTEGGGGRGWAPMERSSPAGSASPRGNGLKRPPAACWAWTPRSRPGPSPRARWEPTTAGACALWSVLGRMLVLCSSLPRGSSGQALGPGASCLYSPQPRGEIPRALSAAHRAGRLFKYAQAEFRSKPQFNVNHK